MTIPFTNLPSNLRVPLFYAEVDNSQANTEPRPQRALLIGQKLPSGYASPNVPILCQGLFDAKGSVGAGSMLAEMVDAYTKNDPTGELWLLPLADDPAATAAAGSISFTGPSTAAGILYLYLGGRLVPVTIASGQTSAQIATSVAAAINAVPDLLVTAAVDGVITSQVNITAKNKGAAGNDIDISTNFLGNVGRQFWPAGVTVARIAMAGGVTNPSLTAALAQLNEMPFDFIVSAYTDAASTSAITALLNDQTGRWSPLSQIYGHCMIALRASSGSAAAFLATLNDQHLSCVPFLGSPTPNFTIAAAMFGAIAASLRDDPGLPVQTLSVAGILPPPSFLAYSRLIRNQLLYEGGSTFTVTNGVVAIENMITTYQTDPQGHADDSYLEIETMFLLMFVLRALQDVVTRKYSRRKLAANGTRLLPLSNVITPDVIKADLIAQYRELEAAGYVQRSDQFAAQLTVEQNATNPNRVDVLYPVVLVDQLRIFALLAQFRLT